MRPTSPPTTSSIALPRCSRIHRGTATRFKIFCPALRSSTLPLRPSHAGSLSLPFNSDDYLTSVTAGHVNDGLAPANFPLGASSYTIAAWVNLDGARSDSNGISGWGTFSTTGTSNVLRTASNNAALANYWWNNDLQANLPSGGLLVGSWHYVAATYDATSNTRTVYEDGVVLGTDHPATPPAVTNLNFAVGAGALGNSEYFSGKMSDLLIANSALSRIDLIKAAANGVTIGTTSIDTALPSGSVLVIASGATLDLGGTSQQVAGVSDPGSGAGGTISSTFGGASAITLSPSGTKTFSGSIQNGAGTTAVTVSTGTQVLSGANTYTGNTVVSGGTLTISSSGSIGSTAVSTAAAATLNANGTTNAGLATTTALTSNGATNIAANVGSTGVTKVTLAGVTIGLTGAVTMADPGLANHANRKVLVANSLSFAGSFGAWGGKLNLATNDLVIHGGSLANITNQVKQAYNGSAWTGTAGIFATVATSDKLHALGVASGLASSFDGISLVTSDVAVKYTYYGDADLSGFVTGNDYTLIDSGFSVANSTGWQNGDFNYDGHIDGSDYSLIDNTFNTQSGSLATAAAQLVAATASEISVTAVAAVPEPSILSTIGIGAVGFLGRRNRQKRKDN